MKSEQLYKQLLSTYLLFQQWKKAVTTSVGSSATTRELMYMFDIYAEPGKTIGHYAVLNMVTPGTYTATKNSLLRKKLITIVKDKTDERIRLLSLTALGKAVVEKNLLYFQRLIDRLSQELGKQSGENFAKVVVRAGEVMRDRLKEHKFDDKK